MNIDLRSARPRTTKMIEGMLEQRKEVLVLLWELSKLGSFSADTSAKDTLDEFLEVLVDYIAAGHFGLYERIAEGTERRKPVVETAAEIYPRIAATTEVAVEFSEKYDTVDEVTLEASLAQDLSTLGEDLATRIELEDKLILAMLGAEFQIPPIMPQPASE